MFMEHASRRDVLEINYCHTGTIGWDMHCEKSVYLNLVISEIHNFLIRNIHKHFTIEELSRMYLLKNVFKNLRKTNRNLSFPAFFRM